MKIKIKVIISLLFIGLFHNNNLLAQTKYGFVVAKHKSDMNDGQTLCYVSSFKDLTKLPKCDASEKNISLSQKSLVDFYSECISNWFNNYLLLKDIKFQENLTVSYINTKNQVCPNGNENTCFMNIEEAAKFREELMARIRSTKNHSVIVIE